MEIISYGGWDRCARFAVGDIELIVTLEVGPRVLSFGFVGGPNELCQYERHRGLKGGSEYRSYGGHRLWVSPELQHITYEPDNDDVQTRESDEGWVFSTPLGHVGIERSIEVIPVPERHAFRLVHRLTNHREDPFECAPWCVTVMAPGGQCLIPQAPYVSHSETFLPARPIVLWPYTRMSDSRLEWGDEVIRVLQTGADTPQKIGSFVEQGFIAYANHENLFMKRFDVHPGKVHADFGCNVEVYTRHDMLEVESLGPLVTLNPGETCTHTETWYLMRDVLVPSKDDECADLLREYMSSHPHLG